MKKAFILLALLTLCACSSINKEVVDVAGKQAFETIKQGYVAGAIDGMNCFNEHAKYNKTPDKDAIQKCIQEKFDERLKANK